MAKSKHKEINLLDCVPTRMLQWENDEDGTVIIKEPKFKSVPLQSLARRLGRSPYYKIHLDEFGSFVWEKCDGNSRVEQIGMGLKQKFGNKVEPVYERLAAFMRLLAYQRFITYKGKIHSNS